MNLSTLEEFGMRKQVNYSEINVYIKNKQHPDERVTINNSSAAYGFLKNLYGMEIETREIFFAVMLNNAQQVIAVFKVSSGGLASCLVDAKLIFCAALNCLAAKILICHNHPSGNLKISDNDKLITDKLVAGAKLLDLHIMDHVIVTDYSYTSFLEEGLI